MADTTTTNYSFTKPENGASDDSWGIKLNANWDALDTALKSVSDTASGALPKAGGTATGKVIFATSATGSASFNIPHGVAPTSPGNGDTWTTTAGWFVRINGTTRQALFSGDSIPASSLTGTVSASNLPSISGITGAGTAAGVDTGTSGSTLGLLNADKTDSGNNTYSGTSAFTGQATFSKQINGPEAALTDGASIAWDLSTKQAAHVTLAGNRTLANPTNMVAGGSYAIKITQDGTGSRTLAYGTAYKWAGGVAPVLSTAAGSVDLITFYSDGTNMYGAALKAFS